MKWILYHKNDINTVRYSLRGGYLQSESKTIQGRFRYGELIQSSSISFRMSAYTLHGSNSAFGAFYRRQRARLGAPKAITATAHKLARTFYSMLKNGTEYVDFGKEYYEKQYEERVLKNLKKRAASLGFQLVSNIDQGSENENLVISKS